MAKLTDGQAESLLSSASDTFTQTCLQLYQRDIPHVIILIDDGDVPDRGLDGLAVSAVSNSQRLAIVGAYNVIARSRRSTIEAVINDLREVLSKGDPSTEDDDRRAGGA